MSKLIQIKFIHFYAYRIVNYQIIYRTYGYAEYAEYAAGAATQGAVQAAEQNGDAPWNSRDATAVAYGANAPGEATTGAVQAARNCGDGLAVATAITARRTIAN